MVDIQNEVLNILFNMEREAENMEYSDIRQERLSTLREAIRKVENIEAADVQPINQCKMIPHEPDCRGYTDTFFCTNCQLHIHLGFIGQRYGGNYCIECGAEVEDGDTNG